MTEKLKAISAEIVAMGSQKWPHMDVLGAVTKFRDTLASAVSDMETAIADVIRQQNELSDVKRKVGVEAAEKLDLPLKAAHRELRHGMVEKIPELRKVIRDMVDEARELVYYKHYDDMEVVIKEIGNLFKKAEQVAETAPNWGEIGLQYNYYSSGSRWEPEAQQRR